MSKSTRAIGGTLFVLLALLGALIVGATMQNDNKVDDTESASNSTDVCPSVEGVQTSVPEGFLLKDDDCVVDQEEVPTAEEIAEAIEKDLRSKGFKPDEWTLDPDWSKNKRDVASAFSDQTLKTREDVKNFLNGSSVGSKKAKGLVLDALSADVDRQRALSGEGYYAIQFKNGVQYEGQTYLDGDKIITPDGLRQAETGDVIWLFIQADGKINWGASIRADCGNPEFTRIVPVRPGTPPAPPVTCLRDCKPPKCPPGQVGTPPDCLTPKDANQGTDRQGNNRPGGSGKAPKQTDPIGPPKGGTPPETYTAPDPPASSPKPPKDSTPTPQPSEPPATGANDGDDGGTIDQPDW